MAGNANGGETGTDDAEGGTRIRQLDRATVERIAAGEVVERPASAVKELVENSLDADANRVEVTVEGDGTDSLRVRDDGVGMNEADVRAAVREHTTSKIRDIEDLEAGVGTLGFRGEALHTIGAVSRLTVTSKPRGADGAGTRLRYEGGTVESVDPAGCPEGTTIEVADLFFNTPARRKYLKTEATEFAHVNRVVSRYALANPDVAVSLTHDGRETFATTGRGDLQEAVMSVYGREVAESMVPVVAGDPKTVDAPVPDANSTALPAGEGNGDDRPTAVAGYVSHPETTRSSREYVTTFVNGRYVRSSTVREAVVDAYGDQLASDRFPFAALFLSVPPETVDVNVHPRKTEVRFRTETAVRRGVRRAVREALLDDGLLRSGAPRGQSAPAETAVAPDPPTGDEDEYDASNAPPDADPPPSEGDNSDPSETGDVTGVPSGGDGSDTDDGLSPASPVTRLDPDSPPTDRDPTNASTPDTPSDRDPTNASTPDTPTDRDPTNASTPDTPSDEGDDRAVDRLGTGEDVTAPDTDPTTAGGDDVEGSASDDDPTPGLESEPENAPNQNTGSQPDSHRRRRRRRPRGDDREDDGNDDSNGNRDGGRKFVGGTEQRTLDGEVATPTTDYDALPRMRVLGQFDGTYVVAETPSGLVLIDQHAADERVNYERLRAAFEDGDGTVTQTLANPVDVPLTPGEAATFESARAALDELGFRATLMDDDGNGDGTDRESGIVRVEAVPAVFSETVAPERVRDVLNAFVTGDHEGPVADAAENFLADLACYPSLTGNTSLAEGDVLDLLSALDACENPWACPHGRPVVVELDHEEVEARFERDYPGHDGRRPDGG
jgi:DNA mismatch repair protein MutL